MRTRGGDEGGGKKVDTRAIKVFPQSGEEILKQTVLPLPPPPPAPRRVWVF